MRTLVPNYAMLGVKSEQMTVNRTEKGIRMLDVFDEIGCAG